MIAYQIWGLGLDLATRSISLYLIQWSFQLLECASQYGMSSPQPHPFICFFENKAAGLVVQTCA